MATAWIYLAIFIMFVGLVAEVARWRDRAEQLNEENLDLSQQLDDLKREQAGRPQVRFGPHTRAPEPKETPSAFPELLYAERPKPQLPNAMRNVLPFQRRAGEQS